MNTNPWKGEIITTYQAICATCESGSEIWDAANGGKRDLAATLRREGWDYARWCGWRCPSCASDIVRVDNP